MLDTASRFSPVDGWSVEKPAKEGPSGHRFLAWVIRHLGWHYGKGIQPVQQTGNFFVPAFWRIRTCRMFFDTPRTAGFAALQPFSPCTSRIFLMVCFPSLLYTWYRTYANCTCVNCT